MSSILGEKPEQLGSRVWPTATCVLDHIFRVAEKAESVPSDLFTRVIDEAREYWAKTQTPRQDIDVAEGLIYRDTLDRVLADKEVSLQEMMLVNQMLACIEVNRDLLIAFRDKLEWVGWYWEASHGRLPVRDDPPVRLSQGEVCHVVVPVAGLFEHATARRQFGGGSAGVSFRVAKGVTMRFGQFRGQSVPVAELRLVGQVQVCVTSQRLCYTGERSSEAIPLRNILNIECFQDGVVVHREGRSKRTLILKMEEGDAQRVYYTVESLLADGH
jgi:hypothetical protein